MRAVRAALLQRVQPAPARAPHPRGAARGVRHVRPLLQDAAVPAAAHARAARAAPQAAAAVAAAAPRPAARAALAAVGTPARSKPRRGSRPRAPRERRGGRLETSRTISPSPTCEERPPPSSGTLRPEYEITISFDSVE